MKMRRQVSAAKARKYIEKPPQDGWVGRVLWEQHIAMHCQWGGEAESPLPVLLHDFISEVEKRSLTSVG